MKTIVFLSGKRYSGKNTFAFKLKDYYEQHSKKVRIVSISEPLKRAFCNASGLPIERFLSNTKEDHAFKNSHKAALNAFFKQNNPMIFIKMMDSVFEEDYDVFIVDDLRIKGHIDYINHRFRPIYKVRLIRINALPETKVLRGWKFDDKDKEKFESELDDYANFDLTVDNDFGEIHLMNAINANSHLFLMERKSSECIIL